MAQIHGCRTRRIVGNEVIEIDAYLATPEDWAELCRRNPSYHKWSTAPLDGRILATEPLPLEPLWAAFFEPSGI
jgi:hypothetical protein